MKRKAKKIRRVVLCQGKVVKVKRCHACESHHADTYEMHPEDGFADYSFGNDCGEFLGKRVVIYAEVIGEKK